MWMTAVKLQFDEGANGVLTPAPGTPHGGEEPAPADPPSEWGITPLTTAPHTQSQSTSVFLVLISEQLVLKTQVCSKETNYRQLFKTEYFCLITEIIYSFYTACISSCTFILHKGI